MSNEDLSGVLASPFSVDILLIQHRFSCIGKPVLQVRTSGETDYRSGQVESLRKSVYYTQELLKAASATYLEVLTAQQNYLSAQLATVNDKLEKAQAVIDLYRTLGGGN
jgi:hypothetical protein